MYSYKSLNIWGAIKVSNLLKLSSSKYRFCHATNVRQDGVQKSDKYLITKFLCSIVNAFTYLGPNCLPNNNNKESQLLKPVAKNLFFRRILCIQRSIQIWLVLTHDRGTDQMNNFSRMILYWSKLRCFMRRIDANLVAGSGSNNRITY